MSISLLVERLKQKLDILYEPTLAVFQFIIILILAVIIVRVGSYLIRKIFEKQKSFKYRMDEKRIATMSTLSVSVFRYAVYIMAGVAILTKLTQVFRLQSVMTAAGIGGIAIGFGAQSLIKDVISGFFIIMENQYVVGDMVTIENMTGTVEEMELRVTKLRNFNGDLHIIPNGEIKKITNHVRGNKAVIVDVPVAYSANVDEAMVLAQSVCEEVEKEFETIVEAPKVLGITELGKESMNLRITAKALPNEQWAVERRIRKRIKEEFDRANIEFFDRNKIVGGRGLQKGEYTDG